jgi:serine/threonine protein kinase
MNVSIECPSCSKTYRVDRSLVGKSAVCKKCQTRFTIEHSDEERAREAQRREASASAANPAENPSKRLDGGNESSIRPADAGSSRDTARMRGLDVGTIGAGTSGGPTDIPEWIGRFKVHSRLGAGAFGAVYRAFDPQLSREVAIKVPQPAALQSATARQLFYT